MLRLIRCHPSDGGRRLAKRARLDFTKIEVPRTNGALEEADLFGPVWQVVHDQRDQARVHGIIGPERHHGGYLCRAIQELFERFDL